jgi:hypothetical protein
MTGMYVALGSTIAKGFATKSADDAAANQMTQEAGQSVAAGIQGAEAMRRRTGYVASNAQAKIAGGGLSTTGTSAQTVLGNIKGQGEYEALTSLYQGNDRANELQFRASQMENAGTNAVAAGFIGGATSVLSSGSSFYSKYGATS